ncbi:FAD-dependent oxidoreductase [Paradesulfitobacterium ferrireducens]|uniref:FAD-dependent oxidoreductase n=1 Tax=Paradesulfitobacterium ferrireducens TaxID=2816476 RepID=UPI001A8D4E83|nr:flavocytochrome c [Paradesulfitobacterium ferrireducens]
MNWDAEVDIAVVGAGGCGLVAALAASDQGAEVVILEKTEHVLGNTASSAGMIQAAGTRFQRELGIDDSPEQMAKDIFHKNGHESDPELTLAVCRASGPMVEWMVDKLGIELSLFTEFKWPGHSHHRMHAPKSRSGLELINQLRREVAKREDIYLMLKSPVTRLLTGGDGQIIGVETSTPDGIQRIGAKKVILASNGFGGNKEMVQQYIPEMAEVLYFGYEANTGDAIKWGLELGAQVENMTCFQGHASVASSHGILVTWGGVMSGGFLVNQLGKRFGDESEGYSEYALEVMKQPGRIANYIMDEEIHQNLLSIEDYKNLAQLHGLKIADTPEGLAQKLGLPEAGLAATIEQFNQAVQDGQDSFGRTWFPKKLKPPFYGVKVEPALFHTQGGLKINVNAQVLNTKGEPIPNLYAGGGAAVGVSGRKPKGYMSGNGLLAALGFGFIAGRHAAENL